MIKNRNLWRLSNFVILSSTSYNNGRRRRCFSKQCSIKKITESFRDWGRDCWCPPGKDNTCGERYCQKLGELPEGYDHKYTYSHIGFNLKATDMQAAVGLSQLNKADTFIEKEGLIIIYSIIS